MIIQANPLQSPALRFLAPKRRTPADFAVAKSGSPETTRRQLAHPSTDLLKRFFAFCPAVRLVCRSAWELTGITRIDRYDIARPTSSFKPPARLTLSLGEPR